MGGAQSQLGVAETVGQFLPTCPGPSGISTRQSQGFSSQCATTMAGPPSQVGSNTQRPVSVGWGHKRPVTGLKEPGCDSMESLRSRTAGNTSAQVFVIGPGPLSRHQATF